MGAIYIAHDVAKPNLAKIGMTTKSGFHRVSQTENPDYILFIDYKVSDEVVKGYESIIHRELEKIFTRREHKSTGKKSEWFECSPAEAAQVCEKILGVSDKSKLSTLNNTVKKLSKENVKLQNESDGLLEQVYKLTSMLSNSNELKKLTIKNDILIKSKKKYNSQSILLENEISSLTNQVSDLNKQIDKLNNDVKTEKSLVEVLELDIKFAKSNNVQLARALKRVESPKPVADKGKGLKLIIVVSIIVFVLIWRFNN